MSSKTFMVNSFRIDTDKSEIFWDGRRLVTYGHLLCLGNEDRFIVYFLGKRKRIPDPVYIPEYNLGAIFVNTDQKDAYLALARVEETIYVHMNKERPEKNAITIKKPTRVEMQGY